ncbi:MAG: hypothetical protein AAFR74_02320 [Pseudomonadota bacterium]
MADKPAFSNDEKTSRSHLFQKGNKASPGRPKGSRNKLGEAFIADLFAAWERDGADAIQRVIRDKPDVFLKVVSTLIPKQVDINPVTINKIELVAPKCEQSNTKSISKQPQSDCSAEGGLLEGFEIITDLLPTR